MNSLNDIVSTFQDIFGKARCQYYSFRGTERKLFVLVGTWVPTAAPAVELPADSKSRQTGSNHQTILALQFRRPYGPKSNNVKAINRKTVNRSTTYDRRANCDTGGGARHLAKQTRLARGDGCNRRNRPSGRHWGC